MISDLGDIVKYELKFTKLLSFSALENLRERYLEKDGRYINDESLHSYNILLSEEFSNLYNNNWGKFFLRRCSTCRKIYMFGKWDYYDLRDGINVPFNYENYVFSDGFCSPECMSRGSKIPLSMAIEIFNSIEKNID